MFHTEVIGLVEALFAPTDPVVNRGALLLHLLVIKAEVVAVQAPGQVVPQLGVVVGFAWRALGGSGGCAVGGHVSAWWTLVTGENFPGGRVYVLVLGNGFHSRSPAKDTGKQEQDQEKELRRKL